MKKILPILFLLLLLCGAHGQATITFSMTNALGAPDTNAIKLQALQSYANANGSYQTTGLPFWIYPSTNGYVQTNLSYGFWLATNQFLINNFFVPGSFGSSQGVVFAVPQGSGTYAFGLLAQPGYNTYNFNPLLSLYTNVIAVLGFTPLTPTQTTNLFNLCNTNIYAAGSNVSLTISNGVTLINAVLNANNLTNVVLTTGNTNLILLTNGVNSFQLTVPTQWFLTNGVATTGFVNSAVAPLASTSYVNTAIAPLATTAALTAATNSVASVALADLIEYSNSIGAANLATSNSAFAANLATSNTLQLTKQTGSLLLSNAVAVGYINTNNYLPGTNVFFFTNSSGIFVEVPYQTWLTNTLGSAAYAPASQFLGTNSLPGLTNGFVTPGSLASYALISYVQTYAYPTNNPQSFTAPNQVTNIAAYQALIATQSLGSAAFTPSSAYDAAGRALAATNAMGIGSGLMAFQPTNNYESTGTTLAATNAIGIASGLSAFVSTNRFDTNGAGNYAYTNNMLGYQTAAQVTNIANALTNGGNLVFTNNPILVNALTNSSLFIASTNGRGVSLAVSQNLNLGAKTNWLISTNLIGINGAGSSAANGTYVGAPFVNGWTNYASTNFQIILTGGNFYIQSNGVSLYQSSNITNWTAISGATPVPFGAYCAYWNLDGAYFAGTPYFPWLLNYIQTNSTSLSSSNSTVEIVASVINSHTNYDLSVLGGGGGIAVTNGTGYGTTLIGAKQIQFPVMISTGGAGTFNFTNGLPSNGYFVITGNSSDGGGNSFNGVYTNQNTLVSVGPSGTGGTYAGWQYELATPPGVQQDFICICTNLASRPGWVSMYNTIGPTFTTTNGAPILTNSSSFIPNTIPSSFSGVGTPVVTYYLPGGPTVITNQIIQDTNSGYLDISNSLNVLGNFYVNGSPPIVPLGFNTNSVVGGLSQNNYFSPQGTNVIVALIDLFGVNPTNGITLSNLQSILISSNYATVPFVTNLVGVTSNWVTTVVSNSLAAQIVAATNGIVGGSGILTLNGSGTNTTLKSAISIAVTNDTVYNTLSFPVVATNTVTGIFNLTNGLPANASIIVTGSGQFGSSQSPNGTYTNQNTLDNGNGFYPGSGGWRFANSALVAGNQLYIIVDTNNVLNALGYVHLYTNSTPDALLFSSTNSITLTNGYATNGVFVSGTNVSGNSTGVATFTFSIPSTGGTVSLTNQIYSDTNSGYLDISNSLNVLGNLYVNGTPISKILGGSSGSASGVGLGYLQTSNLVATGGAGVGTNFNGTYVFAITNTTTSFQVGGILIYTNTLGPIAGNNYFIAGPFSNGLGQFANQFWFCTNSSLTGDLNSGANVDKLYLGGNTYGPVGNYLGLYLSGTVSGTNIINVSYQNPIAFTAQLYMITSQSSQLPTAYYGSVCNTSLGGEFTKTNFVYDTNGWLLVQHDP